MNSVPVTKPKRQPKKIEKIVLRDASAMPGVSLMEAIASRYATPEDYAILDSWAFVNAAIEFARSPARA